MATNSERPRRFDLRTTIPLAAETLVSLARKPKRSWVLPGLTLATGIAFMILLLELLVFPGPVTALAFEGELRSRLSANYGADPVVARLRSLRLTIVEDVLGLDGGDGSEPSAIALLLQDPVPTATPKVAEPTSPADEPSASPMPTDALTTAATDTPLPLPSMTPPPPTAAVAGADYCGKLSILSMDVDGDDEVEAKVRNSGSENVYLIGTFFGWPDVPEEAHLDWLKFRGDKYFHPDDEDSPTMWFGSYPSGDRDDYVKLSKGQTTTWKVDFDDEPDEGIYGSFTLELTFAVPGQAPCILSRSTYKDIPASALPSAVPSDTPAPTNTPAPIDTLTPGPTETATPTNTPDVTATPSETALPTETPT